MLSPRWRKVLRDLWLHKMRTMIVVLSIAVGVFAVGMISSTQIMLTNDLAISYGASDPASAWIFPGEFDQELVETIRHMDGIREAEGRRAISIRIKVGPDEWQTVSLDVIHDFDDIRLNKIQPFGGEWPPPKREMLIERASLSLINVDVGNTVVVETPDGKQRQMRIAGLAHDIHKEPAVWGGRAYAYISPDTLEWLGYSRDFDALYILVDEKQGDKAHIQTIADQVQSKIEKSGRTVYWIWIPEPGEHPANDVVQPLFVILGTLGTLSLFLSGFLVVNTISALMTQQVRQVGMMKAVGASTGQIVRMYLGAILIFGVLSLFIAVPLGALAAYAMAGYIASLINFDLIGFRIPPQSLILEIAVGLIVPVLAALYPIISGARVTVREALSSYGLGKGLFGRNFLDRLIEDVTLAIRAMSRPVRLSLRNTFRRKGRLALTLFTLTLGSAIFIAILSVHASLMATLDDALDYWNYDLEVYFARTHRMAAIEREAMAIPGVAYAESWNWNTARRVYPDGREGPNLNICAPPAETELIKPAILEGRWLLPGDENAIVLNTEVLREESDVKVGDEIILKIEGRETPWRVVGIVRGVLTGPIGYVNQTYFARLVHFVGQAGYVLIVGDHPAGATQQDVAGFQSELAKQIKDQLDGRGMRVSSTQTMTSVRDTVANQLNVIVILLAIMAVLVALVGGLGLMGTMSINVLERTREIGVIRAIGASDGSVVKIFLIEGLFIGSLSWLIGAILALPMSQLLSYAVGVSLLDAPLSYTFSVQGALLWLVAVLILAGLASFLPAWNASRLTVREVLAYE